MREIKFRLFSKDTNKVIYPTENNWFDKAFTGKNGVLQSIRIDVALENPDKVEVMQYTGLKDKKGKEIYEGDIVSRHEGGIHFQEEPLAEHVVKWGNFGWLPFEIGEGYQKCVYGEIYEFIVIGNIYGNPELLGVSK